MIRLILILFLLNPLVLFAQNNFFWSHSGLPLNQDLDFQVYSTAAASSTSFDVDSVERTEYISYGIKYYKDGYPINIDPSISYDSVKSFASYPSLESIYKNFMNTAPYNSVWAAGVDNPSSTDTITIYKDLFFEKEQTLLVGLIGDNYFSVHINGVKILNTTDIQDPNNFTYLNIFEVPVPAGNVRMLFSGLGDGTVAQALGVIVWDNTTDEIYSNPVDKTNWNVLWSSYDAIGTTVYACPSGYTYQSAEGLCVRIADISEWQTGDDIYISMYVAQKYRDEVTSWVLKDGLGSIIEQGTTYDPDLVYTQSSTGDNTFIYEVTVRKQLRVYEETVTIGN